VLGLEGLQAAGAPARDNDQRASSLCLREPSNENLNARSQATRWNAS
jgi:hypothetical protein